MTKMVCFADMHANLFTEFAEVDDITGNSRFTAILNCLKVMRKYCLENNIKYVLDAGDLTHQRVKVDTKVLNGVYKELKAFSDAGITFISIPGNHQQYDNTSMPEHSLETFKDIDNVIVLDKFEPYIVNDEENSPIIFPVPFSKDIEMVKKHLDDYCYRTTNEGLEDRSVLLYHGGVSGSFAGKGSHILADAFTPEDLFPHAFKFLVCGHFHYRQDLGGNPNFFYCGSPIQHNFGEGDQDKGFIVIDLETGTKEFVEIPSPKFITVKVNAKTDMEKVKEELKGNYVRFQVEAENVDELVENLPEDTKFRLDIQKEYKTDTRIDVDVSMSFEEAVKVYAKEFNPEAEEIGLEILGEVL